MEGEQRAVGLDQHAVAAEQAGLLLDEVRAAARRGHEHAGDELPLVKVRIEVHAAQGLAREPPPLLVDVDGGDVVLHGVGGGEGLHARDDGDVVLAGAASVENQELQHEKNTSYSS